MKKQPLIVRRPTKTTDRYGNEVYGPPYTDTQVMGILGAARATEITEGRQTTVRRPSAQLPPGTDVTETDMLVDVQSGRVYNVTGVTPVTQPSTGREWGVVVDLESAE